MADDKLPDGNLDDILASIRKIVAAEPVLELDESLLDKSADACAATQSNADDDTGPDEALLDPGFESQPVVPLPPRTLAGLAAPAPETGSVLTPETGSGLTLEALARSLLEPMLREWLAANLPRIVGDAVEAATQAEIHRLTGRS